MTDPRTVELLARALYEDFPGEDPTNPRPTWERATDAARDGAREHARAISKRFIVVPADTARTGWLHEGIQKDDPGDWAVYADNFDGEDGVRYIVAPDPRTEATDE